MTVIKPFLKSSYLSIISFLGLFFIFQGIIRYSTFSNTFDYLLILLLAAVSQLIGSTPSNEKIQAYEVGSAVGIATIPIYGPYGAALAGVASGFGIWLSRYSKYSDWRQSIKVLGFNMGMFSVAMFISGWVFIFIQTQLVGFGLLSAWIPWLGAAVVNDQINLLLLFGVVRLQQGLPIKFAEFWQTNLWAALINIMVSVIGGGLLSSATQLFGWRGIAIFFMPIILSAFAFRLYVNQMKSHLDNLESIISERTEALQNIMKEKDAFLAVLTHDMKTPLTSIGICVDVIRQYPHLIQEKPQIIETVGNSQKTLLNIVTNILDLEKLKVDGKLPLDLKDFDIVSTLEATAEMLKMLANDKNISLKFVSPWPSLMINGDRQNIERVFQNLISNAIKYSPKDSQICIEMGHEDGFVKIEIVDTGYGIPEDDLPFIFDRFRRVAEHEKVAIGTGLGLAISKAIVETHGGEISVFSKIDVGSTFTIKLPL